MNAQQQIEPKQWHGPNMHEFIAMMAALMASNALAIDAMLPALPAIGKALHVGVENQRQLVITAYLIGFGSAQLFYGPVSDSVGRKFILAVSLGFYGLCAIASGLATSFPMLLVTRLFQGMAAAGTRVLVMSIVRDRFQSDTMARVMSLVFIVFMIVPVLAPAFGQAVLAIASWRFIFIGLGVYAVGVLFWLMIRLPETHPPERRRPFSPKAVGNAITTTLCIRESIGNTIALTLIIGGLFGFINSIQQIVFDVYERPDMLALVFACIAGPMALSSYLNSRIVERLGSRRILLLALAAFCATAALHLILALLFNESLVLFVIFQSISMASFGLISANLGAIAMLPVGHVAGTASSVQGFITTVGGALVGLAIGQAFNGSIIPMLTGFAICGILSLLAAIWANRISPDLKNSFRRQRLISSPSSLCDPPTAHEEYPR